MLRDDETEPPRIRGEPPDDEIHFLGKTEPVATDLKQIARGDHALQLPLEAGTLFAGHAKQLYQLARSGRVMDRLTNALEKILITPQRE
jgi:hypothetical protein